jgi:hypothetical protein
VDLETASYAVSGPRAPVEILIDRWGVPLVDRRTRRRPAVGPVPRGGGGNIAYYLEILRQTGGSSWRVVDVGE